MKQYGRRAGLVEDEETEEAVHVLEHDLSLVSGLRGGGGSGGGGGTIFAMRLIM